MDAYPFRPGAGAGGGPRGGPPDVVSTSSSLPSRNPPEDGNEPGGAAGGACDCDWCDEGDGPKLPLQSGISAAWPKEQTGLTLRALAQTLEVEAALAEAQVVASFAKLHEARKEDWDLDEHHCEGGETRYGREGDAAEAEDVEYAGEEHQHEELGSAVARTWSVMIRHAGGN